MKYILFILFSLNSLAVVINNNDLIVVHPTTYYHSDSQTINYSNELVSRMNSVLLYQNEPSTNSKWYILRDRNQTEIYSVAGRFNPEINNKKLNVSLIGGYLTHCLGRASASLIAKAIDSKNIMQLNLYLKTRGIFTGHLMERGEIVPATPYEESILDDTIDGLNLFTVLDSLSYKSKVNYLMEAVQVGIFKTYDVINTQSKNYLVNVFYKKNLLDTFSFSPKTSGKASTQINVYFEDK